MCEAKRDASFRDVLERAQSLGGELGLGLNPSYRPSYRDRIEKGMHASRENAARAAKQEELLLDKHPDMARIFDLVT